MGENGSENRKKRNFGSFFSILIMAESIVAVIIITVLLVMKMFVPSIFSEIEKEYKLRLLTETTVNEVLGDEEKTK